MKKYIQPTAKFHKLKVNRLMQASAGNINSAIEADTQYSKSSRNFDAEENNTSFGYTNSRSRSLFTDDEDK